MAKNEGSHQQKMDKLWLRTYQTGGRNKYRTRRQGKKFEAAIRTYCNACDRGGFVDRDDPLSIDDL